MLCQIWHSLLELLNLQAKATMFLTEIKITADFSQEEELQALFRCAERGKCCGRNSRAGSESIRDLKQKVKLVNPKLYGRGYAIGDMGHTDYVLLADDIVAVEEK